MAPNPDTDPQSTPTLPWTRLQLSRRRNTSDLPPLFYKLIMPKPTSTPSAPRLVLHCTDLTILYTASLTHADILAEATRQHSPIDPSESSKQLAVLLDYLSQSLAGKDNVLARTAASEGFMALEAGDEGDFSAKLSAQLTLRTTIPLPRPLRPLSFAFTLARQEPAAFSRVVLCPALEGTQMANRKLDALLDVVRDKDHVIARLLERVGNQASGDMSLVFPTLTGRRGRGGEKVGVEEAGRLVPGLKEFDLGSWEAGQGFEHAGGFEELLLGKGFAKAKEGESSAEWVRNLPGPEALERGGDDMNGKRRLSRQVTRETTRGSQVDGDIDDENDDATESDDDFERQPTPPSARKAAGSTKTTPQKSSAGAQQSREGPASSSEDDSGPPTKKQKTSGGGGIGSGKRAGRLGGLGGRSKRAERKASSSPEQDAASPAPAAVVKKDDKGEKRRPSTASTATASATDREAEPPPPTTRSYKIQKKGGDGGKREPTPPTASPSPEPIPSESSTPAKKKGRLGRLGGRDKGRTTDTRTSSVEASDATTTTTTGRHRLGNLGGARRGTKQADAPAADPAAEDTVSDDDDGGHGKGDGDGDGDGDTSLAEKRGENETSAADPSGLPGR
ncbi:MAG: hypothetical protein INR71_11715, partial [Terriglobus roseus]|nr:hypothetical protein [Terriglobus roseus]